MKIKRTSTQAGILLAALFACLFSADLAFAEKPSVKPVGQVVVVDSKGKIVGNAMGGLGLGIPEPWLPVLLKIDERVIRVYVARDRLAAGNLYFNSANCHRDTPDADYLYGGTTVDPHCNWPPREYRLYNST